MMRIVVVTGGTQIDWDDMRTLTNKSKGKFGVRIANGFVAEGHEVTLIHAESVDLSVLTPAVTDSRPFRTYDDLAEALFSLREEPFDAIVMAAAVSDYRFSKVEGKIVSKKYTITVTIHRTPKLLSKMRDWYQEFRPFIVGFKLLSGVTWDKLQTVAFQQMEDCRINMTVANDWQELQENPGRHPCFFATPEGGFIPQNGTKDEVAIELARFVSQRADVAWGYSRQMEDIEIGLTDLDHKKRAGKLLSFAQGWKFLYNASGNISTRAEDDGVWVTPRGTDKSKLGVDDLIYAKFDSEDSRTEYLGELKPSIDTLVHATIYETLPEVDCIMHCHGGYIIPNFVTTFPYPCGTIDEADEVLNAMDWEFDAKYGVGIRLIDHGNLLLLRKGAGERLESEAGLAFVELMEHWTSIGEDSKLMDTSLSPIIADGQVVGIVAKYSDWHSVHLNKKHRGKGYGSAVAEILAEERKNVAVHDKCGAIDFYKSVGYVEIRRQGPLTIMGPA
jgi:ribulose-5-phosphate 4-epimerase/fuculose-1-phosphate aldolase